MLPPPAMQAGLSTSLPLLLLLLLLSLLSDPAAADSYKACQKHSDCNDTSHPICNVYWRMKSTDNKNLEAKGICVQCMDDCDCPVGKYCAADFELTKFSPTLSIASDDKKRVELLSQAYQGLRIPSMCKSYSSDIRGGCVAEAYLKKGVAIKSQKNANGVEIFSEVASSILATDQKKFCGKINSFNPKAQECIGDKCSGSTLFTSTETFVQVCSKTIQDNLLNYGACGESVTGDTYGFSFTSNAIDWNGTCYDGGCRECAESATRCGSGSGQPQVCIGGKWRLKQDLTAYTFGADGVQSNAQAQLLLGICVMFAFACAMMVIVSVVKCIKSFFFSSSSSSSSSSKEGASREMSRV
ncbi:hypothetical protein GUITHDRAFT_117014 [Guillardia theta CCMP2712]|uniref:Uncharacterized protein n=1 Tax=Guillardia theta (strain CCMP2712) TaxID=905079 RepID=L1ILU2_GUITC|nr:hypothetical protein GUITHDRAFT_117014 [Guillardia theta CCMP2712]EKX36849.1 hypothetical protein GUITHDRAFT_117014 [Guillardia theta CCMP2712]|eukprot:XP_005823829.1 hypothetical protein GUITHDRAFT_117014 [Guillardia theta CCMP2712]